jgi:hypothetical protein
VGGGARSQNAALVAADLNILSRSSNPWTATCCGVAHLSSCACYVDVQS